MVGHEGHDRDGDLDEVRKGASGEVGKRGKQRPIRYSLFAIRYSLPRQHVLRIPPIRQRLEPHRARVDHQQSSDQAFAEPHDLADRLERHHGTDDADERAENAGLLAGRHRAGRRRLGEKTSVGRIGAAVRGILRLSRTEAKRLRKELMALLTRVSERSCAVDAKSRTKRRRYTLTIALLPADREEP